MGVLSVLASLVGVSLVEALALQVQKVEKPNIVFIIDDDINTMLGHFGWKESHTPNLDALASDGISFPLAYSNHPLCAPSRSSLFYGIHAKTSGNYFGDGFNNKVLLKQSSMQNMLKKNDYTVYGTGKIMNVGEKDPRRKEHYNVEYQLRADFGPMVGDDHTLQADPTVPKPYSDQGPLEGSFGRLSDIPEGSKVHWTKGFNAKATFEFDEDSGDRDPMYDEKNAAWAVQVFKNHTGSNPFAVFIGLVKPHLPLNVPDEFFEEVGEMPLEITHDTTQYYRDSVGNSKRNGATDHYDLMVKSYKGDEGFKLFGKAYLAGIAEADRQVGVICDGLKEAGKWDNTIVIFTADHGWHMATKDSLGKNTPWEGATHIPMIFRGPGIKKGLKPEMPVSLIDLYPTVMELVGITASTGNLPLDGTSMVSLLTGSETWSGPEAAFSIVHPGKGSKLGVYAQIYALRTKEWRYILFPSGGEELYHHTAGGLEGEGEAENVIDTNKDVKISMRKLLMNYTNLVYPWDGKHSVNALPCPTTDKGEPAL